MTTSTIQAINILFNNEIINYDTRASLIKRAERLAKGAAKKARQAEVNAEVATHLMMITPGELFKHRRVWEAAGRTAFTRDEISKALQFHKDCELVKQVRKGPNNFQVFWTRCVAESAGAELEE